MKNQIITDTVQIVIQYVLGTANMENVLHAQYTTTPGEAELDALEAAIVDWLTTEWSPIAAPGYEAVSVVLTDMGSLTGIRKAYAISPAIAGGATGDAYSPNATLAVRAAVGRRGKGIQGRVFWVGLSESQVAGYTCNSTTCTDIVSSLTDLKTRVAAVAPFVGLAIAHLFVNKVPQNPALSELVTNFLITDAILDSQRDRLPGHRRHTKKKTPVPTP